MELKWIPFTWNTIPKDNDNIADEEDTNCLSYINTNCLSDNRYS